MLGWRTRQKNFFFKFYWDFALHKTWKYTNDVQCAPMTSEREKMSNFPWIVSNLFYFLWISPDKKRLHVNNSGLDFSPFIILNCTSLTVFFLQIVKKRDGNGRCFVISLYLNFNQIYMYISFVLCLHCSLVSCFILFTLAMCELLRDWSKITNSTSMCWPQTSKQVCSYHSNRYLYG